MQNTDSKLVTLLTVVLLAACVADDDAPTTEITGELMKERFTDEPTTETLFVSDARPGSAAALEEALRTFGSDDITLTFYERTSTADIRVDLERFAELAQGFTIEINADVKLPNGSVTRHEFGWTSGDDLEAPRIEFSVSEYGRYEVLFTGLAIDGQPMLDAPAPIRTVDLLKDGSALAQELAVTAPNNGAKWLVCKWHNYYYSGTTDDDVIYGGTGTQDQLHGDAGNDVLISGKCNDVLWGDQGSDVLRAGSDYDTCYGGTGFDTFESCEIIPDWELGEPKL